MTYPRSPLLAGVLLIGSLVFLAFWSVAAVHSTGSPFADALRLPEGIAQIIVTQERYLPSLHRDPSRDRYRIDLLLIPIDSPDRAKLIPLARNRDRSVLHAQTRILGSDPRWIWVHAGEIVGVNRDTHAILREADLLKANPELHDFGGAARIEFNERLVWVSPDRRRALALSPDNLTATACTVPRLTSGFPLSASNPFRDFLAVGAWMGSNTWIGALTPKELERDFRIGSSLPRDFRPGTLREPRLLHRVQSLSAEPPGARPRITEVQRLSETPWLEPSLLLAPDPRQLLVLDDPRSLLMLHRNPTSAPAVLTLRRIDLEGHDTWSSETGIGTLRQIIPGTDPIVLIGERPAVPGKVSEPILVFIDSHNGTVRSVSLWR